MRENLRTTANNSSLQEPMKSAQDANGLFTVLDGFGSVHGQSHGQFSAPLV
jgi:hypothetical protein